jgi:MFS family permease
MGGLVGSCQSIGLVSAPIIGGALIDAFSWRACFGINLPLGVLCVALTAYGFHDPVPTHTPPYLSRKSLSASTSWALYLSFLQSRVS